jgi:hypothetical protein
MIRRSYHPDIFVWIDTRSKQVIGYHSDVAIFAKLDEDFHASGEK